MQQQQNDKLKLSFVSVSVIFHITWEIMLSIAA